MLMELRHVEPIFDRQCVHLEGIRVGFRASVRVRVRARMRVGVRFRVRARGRVRIRVSSST